VDELAFAGTRSSDPTAAGPQATAGGTGSWTPPGIRPGAAPGSSAGGPPRRREGEIMRTTPSMARMHPVMPIQYLYRRGDSLGEPQRRLMIAVVRTALEDCALTTHDGEPGGRRPHPGARREAAAFLLSHDRTWPFSFENICEAIGLDADQVRRQLRMRSTELPPGA